MKLAYLGKNPGFREIKNKTIDKIPAVAFPFIAAVLMITALLTSTTYAVAVP